MMVSRRTLIVPLLLAAACSKTESEPLPDLLIAREGGELIFGHPQNDCAECHANHVTEWSISPHAYAMKDPVFHAMSRLGQKQSKGKLGQFCIQCHSPPALAYGTTPVVFDEADQTYKQDTENVPELEGTGVSCDVCHSITDVLEPVNARAILTPNGTRRGPIQDPLETPAHLSQYSELHERSDLCGMCHAVTNPKGAKVEETFPEWQNSSFAEEGGQTCQDCHMPSYTGKAAPDAPERTLHRHTMVGVDVSLLPPEEFPGYDEMRQLASDLLKASARMAVSVDSTSKQVAISIQNLAGHALPSGATAERQMWIEMIVKDQAGNVVFETGTFDENGDIRDSSPKHTTQPGTDPQLIYYGQQMIDDPKVADPNSTAPLKEVSFPWQANDRINYLIAADATDQRSLDLSALGPGSYTSTVRLLFRTFPMYFLRDLEVNAGLDPMVKTRVPIVEIQSAEPSFTF